MIRELKIEKINDIGFDIEKVSEKAAKLYGARERAKAEKGIDIEEKEIVACLASDTSPIAFGDTPLSQGGMSISRIETYATCPLKHYLRYVLKLKENERAEISAINIGNVLHEFCFLFVQAHLHKMR